jgi:hypothetical protein
MEAIVGFAAIGVIAVTLCGSSRIEITTRSAQASPKLEAPPSNLYASGLSTTDPG